MKKLLLYLALAASLMGQSTRVVDTNNLPSWPVGSTNIPISVDSYGRVVSTGGGGGGGTPGGVNLDIQYNNAGAFGGYTPATGFATFLQTATSANLRALVTDETGTGVAVFGTNPTLAGFTLTGSQITTPTNMASTSIDVTLPELTHSIAAPETWTFSNDTPTTGTTVRVKVTSDGTARTITLPLAGAVYSYARGATISSVLVPLSTSMALTFQKEAARWVIFGDPVATSGTGSFALTDSPVFTTQIQTAMIISGATNPADAGFMRLGNAELLEWENSTPGTDLTFGVNASNLFAFSAGITGTTATLSSLTATRVTFAGAAGLLSDDADLTFATDTLTMTKGIVSTTLTVPNGASPTTSAAGNVAFDTDAWAASRGAIQAFDGTANTYVVAPLASDTPTNGQVPTWNTGGTVTWETPAAGGAPVGAAGYVQLYATSTTFTGVAGLVADTTTGALTYTKTGATAATVYVGETLVNTTAAALGAQQYSPALVLQGNGWATNTSDSRAVAFRQYVTTAQSSANPAGTLTWGVSINGGAYSDLISLSSGNIFTVSGLVSSAWVNTGGTGYFEFNARSRIYSGADGSITFRNQANTAVATVVGTATNDSAAAGGIGEYVESLVATGSAVSLTTATAANVTSISLTAGDWTVSGNINFNATTATVTGCVGGILSTSATLPTDGSEVYSGVQLTAFSTTDGVTLQNKRFSLSGTTTVYLVAKSTFSAGTVAAFGKISARRVR